MSLFREIVSRRYLLWQLTAREIKVRYKQSYLGIMWAVVQPLAMTAVVSVVFTLIVPVKFDGPPYPVFAYAGLMLWGLFSRSLALLTDSMVANANLIQKIYFPRQVILLAGIAGRWVDFAIAFGVYFVLMAVYHVPPTIYLLWAVPIVVVVSMLALGMSLFTSALQVFRRDVGALMGLGLQLWFYATPIIYPLEKVPGDWQWVIVANPLTGAVEAFKDAVLRGQSPNFALLGFSTLASVVILVLGHLFFCRAERQFADII